MEYSREKGVSYLMCYIIQLVEATTEHGKGEKVNKVNGGSI